ncbi:MAG: putative hydro-lyase [Deltaproteobacteria bacterium]|nr:putative hydro-lyase [Deltaproteobacteria bacterium]
MARAKEWRLRPAAVRQHCRQGNWDQPTSGLAPGFAQANMVILDRRYAFDFLLFCQRNPKPCPILEVLEPGQKEPRRTAPGADITRDLPRYRIWTKGKPDREVTDIQACFNADLVAFLLGCSFSFEEALLQAGVPVRNIEEHKNVSMYTTNRACDPAGPFSSRLVVTMRPIPDPLVPRAVQITSRYASVHGAPVHIGHPRVLGIKNLDRPDFGDPVTLKKGETPVFWACGVTSTLAALSAKPELCITHAPGHMFITDVPNETLAVI